MKCNTVMMCKGSRYFLLAQISIFDDSAYSSVEYYLCIELAFASIVGSQASSFHLQPPKTSTPILVVKDILFRGRGRGNEP